jgi:A/G-specific adenine glycosylase
VRALPGIGRYTAGAILSIAFGRAEPILDGNVARVLSRVSLEEDPRALWSLAARLVPRAAPGDFNQALMELGATVCTPRAPDCLACPIAAHCAARREGRQEELPRARKKAPSKIVEQVTVLVEKPGRLLLCQRPTAGLWGGLWEPPTGARLQGEAPLEAAARIVRASCGLTALALRPIDKFEHVLSHRRVRFAAFAARPRGRLRVGSDYQKARWLRSVEIADVGVAAWAARLMREL